MTRRERLRKSATNGRGAAGVRARAGSSKARVKPEGVKGFSPSMPRADSSQGKNASIDLAMYRPLKKPITVRIDADVLAWFKKDGRRYQTRINSALRRVMEQEMRGR